MGGTLPLPTILQLRPSPPWWCSLRRQMMHLRMPLSIMRSPPSSYSLLQVPPKISTTISQKKRKRSAHRQLRIKSNWSSKFTLRWWQRHRRNRHEKALVWPQFSSGSRSVRGRYNYANRTMWSMRTNSRLALMKSDKATIHGNESPLIVIWRCRASLLVAMIRQEWNKPC